MSSSTPAASADGSSADAARDRCVRGFSTRTVLAWVPTTVDDVREFQYGPQQVKPLLDAFPGASGTLPASMCGVLGGPETQEWWAVVDGYPAARAITSHGPGEDVFRGLETRQPTVP